MAAASTVARVASSASVSRVGVVGRRGFKCLSRALCNSARAGRVGTTGADTRACTTVDIPTTIACKDLAGIGAPAADSSARMIVAASSRQVTGLTATVWPSSIARYGGSVENRFPATTSAISWLRNFLARCVVANIFCRRLPSTVHATRYGFEVRSVISRMASWTVTRVVVVLTRPPPRRAGTRAVRPV